MKVLQAGFYWPSLFKDAYAMCKQCDKCQRLGKISRRHMMPLNPILVIELFNVWGIDESKLIYVLNSFHMLFCAFYIHIHVKLITFHINLVL